MNFLEKLKIIKKIFTADEYFITVANQHNSYIRKELGSIKYEYFTNSNRELFWKFIHDHIENTKRSITGNFICIRDYKVNDSIIIKPGTQVYLNGGYISNYGVVHRIPTEEIYSHFGYNDI